ncbi:AAA family ATPase [Pontibacter rugosus]|uniref:AAA family ATPase n=1 Tax=Pontibacter rugosus TaxID=1745966 RepID=A0ABW3SUA8_9BACT
MMANKTNLKAPILTTQQRINRLRIQRLKNLVDVTITFDKDKPLTAIMGPNGFGKTTVLHVLAASFRQAQVKSIIKGEEYQYVNFFPSTPHGSWNNSHVTINHYFRRGKREYSPSLTVKKGLGGWSPIAKNKPQRETYYIGVESAVPEIERERLLKGLRYRTQDHNDPQSKEVLEKVGYILSRKYNKSHSNRTKQGRTLLGVDFEGINYSALMMGAGEQRLFNLLKVVLEAGSYSLILIDELDLLLHTDALHRLLEILGEYANKKHLQIIFTTHRESVTDIELQQFVAVRHLYQHPIPPHKTFCFNDTKPAALERLTGKAHKPIQISCEDDTAEAIIQKVVREVGLGGRIEYTKYGAASNCFTLAAALILSKDPKLKHSLLVLDGDVEATQGERENRLKAALSGTEGDADSKRQSALERIAQFKPIGKSNPEKTLYEMVRSITIGDDIEVNQVIQAAIVVATEPDFKKRLRLLADKLGDNWDRALGRIIDVAAQSKSWTSYTDEVRTWLNQQKDILEEKQKH